MWWKFWFSHYHPHSVQILGELGWPSSRKLSLPKTGWNKLSNKPLMLPVAVSVWAQITFMTHGQPDRRIRRSNRRTLQSNVRQKTNEHWVLQCSYKLFISCMVGCSKLLLIFITPEPNHPCQIWNQSIFYWDFGKGWSYPLWLYMDVHH